MRKVIAFKRGRRAPMAQVEECIAHLHEELNLTTAFTGAMVRMGNYRAALGVVEEQRSRVRQVPALFDRAFARPRRKTKAAFAGLAAAALIGSGALAAWVTPNKSEAAQTRQKIERATDMIERAIDASSTELADRLVAAATTAFNALDPENVKPDPLRPDELKDAFALLDKADKVSGNVLSLALEAARKAGLNVSPPPVPEPEKQREPKPPASNPPVPGQ